MSIVHKLQVSLHHSHVAWESKHPVCGSSVLKHEEVNADVGQLVSTFLHSICAQVIQRGICEGRERNSPLRHVPPATLNAVYPQHLRYKVCCCTVMAAHFGHTQLHVLLQQACWTASLTTLIFGTTCKQTAHNGCAGPSPQFYYNTALHKYASSASCNTNPSQP